MRVMFHLPHCMGVLLLAATSFVGAQAPLPDPVAPAVIGRPLDQIVPVRPKPRVAKPNRPAGGAASKVAVPGAVAAAVAPAAAPVLAQAAPAAQQAPKQALDDRVDLRPSVGSAVGQGTQLGRKPLAPGAFFNSRHQALVRQYYEAQPAAGGSATWKIGEPVPARASMTGVPDAMRAKLPKPPPGTQYVQVDGEVVLVAMQSRMVVDGVSRGAR